MSLPKFIIDRPIAHRGLHNETFPENSLSAFKNAVGKNFPIELDVHLTRDGEVVVFHDDNLKRMTGHDLEIKRQTLEEIKKYNLLNTDDKIPTLREVLDMVDGKVPLLVEIKNSGFAGKLEHNTWEILKDYKGEYAIQSFNALSVAWFRKHAPNVARGQLSSFFIGDNLNFLKKNFTKKLTLNFIARPDFINYNFEDLPNKYVERYIKKYNIPLLAWTIRSQEDYDRVKNIVDNVVFENFIPIDKTN